MRRNDGYTFIEILIAMTVLIFGIVAIMRMLPLALYETQLAGEKNAASAHAESELGRMRAVGAEFLGQDFAYDAAVNPPATRRYSSNSANTTETTYRIYKKYYTSVQRIGEPTTSETSKTLDLQRVVYTLETPDGRRESFVTYVAKQ